MPDHCPPTVPRKVAAARDGTRSRLLFALTAFTLIRASAVMAADPAATPPVTLARSDAPAPTAAPSAPAPFAPTRDKIPALPAAFLSSPRDYSLPPAAEPHAFSSTEFRPRGHSVFDQEPAAAGSNENLMVDLSVWQRLQEYRNRDSVRVMTLWESGAGAVSIQTNRKGGPSLEWTSRLMNRGGATRGLLDRWNPASVLKSFSHSASTPAGKTPNPLTPTHPGISAIP
jgi:hypothetical protein